MDFKELSKAFAECLKKDCAQFVKKAASGDSTDALCNDNFFIYDLHK